MRGVSKILIGVFAVFVIILAGVEMAKNLNKIEVKTDKSKYVVGEYVVFTIYNKGTKSVFLQEPFPDHLYVKILRKEGNSFKEIEAVNGDSFIEMGDKQERTLEIKPGKKLEDSWNGGIYKSGFNQTGGVFKAQVVYSTDFEKKGAESFLKSPTKKVESEEFEIGNGNNNISFTTDKTKYLQGEAVTYEIKNIGKKPITIQLDQVEYEVLQKIDGKFENLQTQDPAWLARIGERFIAPLELEPGDSTKGTWSGIVYERTSTASAKQIQPVGIFKFKIEKYESNEFEIVKRPWYRPRISLK